MNMNDLPRDVIQEISQHLPTDEDRLSASQVSQHWRSSVPPISSSSLRQIRNQRRRRSLTRRLNDMTHSSEQIRRNVMRRRWRPRLTQRSADDIISIIHVIGRIPYRMFHKSYMRNLVYAMYFTIQKHIQNIERYGPDMINDTLNEHIEHLEYYIQITEEILDLILHGRYRDAWNRFSEVNQQFRNQIETYCIFI